MARHLEHGEPHELRVDHVQEDGRGQPPLTFAEWLNGDGSGTLRGEALRAPAGAPRLVRDFVEALQGEIASTIEQRSITGTCADPTKGD